MSQTMQEVQPGLFALDEVMPCPPSEVKIRPYTLASTQGVAQPFEEVAVRILSFSQEIDRWVGVTWRKIAAMVDRDIDLMQNIAETEERQRIAEKRHRKLCAGTLGIWGLFAEASDTKRDAIRKMRRDLPKSILFVDGPNFLPAGLEELIEVEMIRVVEIGEGKEKQEVYCPTPKLVLSIMERQRVVAG